MTFTFGFYNAINNDRVYSAEQMSSLFEGIITDGIFMAVGDAFNVTPGSGLKVVVGTGRAWFNNTWSNSDSDIVLDLTLPDLIASRLDTIVLEVNSSSDVRQNSIKIIEGEPGTGVPATLIRSELVNQYALAIVTVNVGATQINSSNILIKTGTTETPYVAAPLANISADQYLSRWNAQFDYWLLNSSTEFTEWFDDIRGQLGTDPAGNLQNQIDYLMNENKTGWTPILDPVSFVSRDRSIGDVSIVGDHRNKFTKGSRFKYKQTQPLTSYVTFDNSSLAALVGDTPVHNGAMPGFVAGAFGADTAVNFTVIQNTLTFPNPSNFQFSEGDFTVGFRFKTSGTNGNALFYAGNGSNKHFRIYFSASGDLVVSTLTTLSTAVLRVNDNQWHSLIVSVNNGYAQLYIDSFRQAYGFMNPANLPSGSYVVKLGAGWNGTGHEMPYVGAIDDFFFISGYGIDEDTAISIITSNSPIGSSPRVLEKMAIVIDEPVYQGGATIVSLYHGSDFSLRNTPITNAAYSFRSSPKNFKRRNDKWSFVYYGYAPAIVNSTTGWKLVESFYVPKGSWDVVALLNLRLSRSSATNLTCDLGLSLHQTNALSSIRYTARSSGASVSSYTGTGQIFNWQYTFNQSTLMYVLICPQVTNLTVNIIDTVVRFTCSYL